MEEKFIQSKKSMSNIALTFGFLALFSFWFIYGALFFGCMSITFALLSRGDELKMPRVSRKACILSGIAIVVTCIITATAFYTLVSTLGWEVFSDPSILEDFIKNAEQSLSLGGDIL